MHRFVEDNQVEHRPLSSWVSKEEHKYNLP